MIVKPEAVVAWHLTGFHLYWRWRSRPRGGRPKITEVVRTLIRHLASENPSWGAPRIHGELQKHGLVISERTVARYLRRVQRPGDPGKRWSTFLQNHPEVIVAFNFFTVPTVTFQLLYRFFVIAPGRRKILHFKVTRHPTADWIVQQLHEAFPEASPHRYVILDRDSRFDADVIAFLQATGLKPKRISGRAPWQNGVSERWVGSARREMLLHVIALNEQHLRRLVCDYVGYYHDDRVHDALEKDAPNRRPVEQKPGANSIVISMPRLGGLHHRYSWQQAAWNHAVFPVLSLIAPVGITDDGHRAAGLAVGMRPNDTVAGISPSRFLRRLLKSSPPSTRYASAEAVISLPAVT